MKSFIKYRLILLMTLIIISCVFIFTACINNQNERTENSTVTKKFEDFAGSQKCMSCHREIYNSNIHTAHYLTSGIAKKENIKGVFDTGDHRFIYSDNTMISMETRTGGLYQVAFINGEEKKKQKFDLFFGSGTKGQSFGSWVQNKLVQLPITYFTASNSWSNSPGYPDKIAFNRLVTSRCLECHTTFVQKKSAQGEEPEIFDRNKMILGVDCESCHGPSKKHVVFQTENPGIKTAKFVINPAALSRQQKLEACMLCHGGRQEKTKPSFEFTPGNNLADFFKIDTAHKDVNNIDVHGNQFGLMAASKCFLKSSTLTCNTCHNTHENEKGKTALFSQRCLGCHSPEKKENVICKLTATIGNTIKTNCIDCHMPEKPSMAIAVMLQGSPVPQPALMHTHYIKAYDEETKKLLSYFKKHK
jgi:hypothetical protein